MSLKAPSKNEIKKGQGSSELPCPHFPLPSVAYRYIFRHLIRVSDIIIGIWPNNFTLMSILSINVLP